MLALDQSSEVVVRLRLEKFASCPMAGSEHEASLMISEEDRRHPLPRPRELARRRKAPPSIIGR